MHFFFSCPINWMKRTMLAPFWLHKSFSIKSLICFPQSFLVDKEKKNEQKVKTIFCFPSLVRNEFWRVLRVIISKYDCYSFITQNDPWFVCHKSRIITAGKTSMSQCAKHNSSTHGLIQPRKKKIQTKRFVLFYTSKTLQ